MATVHYIVRADRVEIVGDRTARAHRVASIDDLGDVVVHAIDSRSMGEGVTVLLQSSAAEVLLIAREVRRARRRMRWARLFGRR